MATAAGLLGSADFTTAAGAAVLYTCPATPAPRKAAVTVSLCNSTGTAAVKARAGWATGAAPAAGQWLLGGVNGKSIGPGETIQVTMLLGPGQKAFAGCDAAGISATCSGLEEML